jgi:3-chloro-4-hydroxyphenylacetate reductive dehalogenase
MGIVTGYLRSLNTNQLDPYPVHKLKRVDRPTTRIDDHLIKRIDGRDSGFNKASRGEYGLHLQEEMSRNSCKYPLGATFDMMQDHLRDCDQFNNPVANHKAPISDDPVVITRHIKELAYFLRSDLVGICELPSYAVLSHHISHGRPVECHHKYAIAILIDQDWKTSEASYGNDWISGAQSYIGYSTSGFIAHILADYIRGLGYPALASYSNSYQVAVPPILLWAGLGEMSRIGDCVVNPFLGPRFKAAVVTTDLPLVIDKPIDFGLQDFCSKCKKCARECPSSALSFGEKEYYKGYERWPLDVKKCVSMRAANKVGVNCGTCMTVCPWNKPFTPFHRFIQWSMRNIPVSRNFAVWCDDLMGYGKPNLSNKWWLDLENVEGKLEIPKFAGSRRGKNLRHKK